MSSNMQLWDSVCMTDPLAVKPITGKTYKGNSPKPYWVIEQATKRFGPCGIGWGVTVKSERFERVGEHDYLHVAVVSVWYVLDGKRSESIDQMGGTKAAYMSKNSGLIVDEDAGKKSVTDGMVKCLSMLGFAGDIFSGRWDDSKYVEQAGQHFRDLERENNPERTAWLAEQQKAINEAKTVGDMRKIVAAALDVASSMSDTDAADQINTWAMDKVAAAKARTTA
jgi:hypothetical protein